jgi:glycosyltransferase involved in cell wall biosynthesis
MTSHLIPPAVEPTIALLPWGHVIEDFLDSIGLSLEDFCGITSGWLFGYVEALRRAGIRTVVFCISAREDAPSRLTHKTTGATIRLLPASSIYRRARHPFQNPYAWSIEETFGTWEPMSAPLRVAREILKDTLPYLATPPLALAQALREEGCRAILCQEYEYARFDVCVTVGGLLRIPVFASFQGGDWQASRFEHLIRPGTLRRCAGLIIAPLTEMQRVQNQYEIPEEKLARIFNPVDLTMWVPVDRKEARSMHGLPLNAEIVMWHGRVEIDRKGLDVLLHAWRLLCSKRTGRELRLLLVGTGNDADKLSIMLDELQLNNVTWVNEFVVDLKVMRSYLSSADVYAFPSRHEGFPVAPIEAMACGLPVAAADASGVPDILEEGEASGGLVVPRGDADALSVALGRLLDDPSWRDELGRRARRRIETCFSVDAIGTQLRKFLARRDPSLLEEPKNV